MNLFVAAREPFSLHSVVYSHGWVQLLPFQPLDGRPGFARVLQLNSGRVIQVEVGETPGGVTVSAPENLDEEEAREVAAQVSWMLELDFDLSPFYAQAAAEPKLAQMVHRAQGRVLRSPTLFEDVIKTILTTNTLWGGTKRMNATLIDLFGDPLPANPALRAFPRPETIAAQDADILKTQARLGYRAPYVLDTARAVASGALDLEALKSSPLPTSELRKALMSIKGVGGYAAANLLMILGRYDYIPIDSWAMKMVSQEWHGGEPVGPAEVEAAFARWDGWKGIAYWFWAWDKAE